MELQNPKNVSIFLKQGAIKESTRFGPADPTGRILYKTSTNCDLCSHCHSNSFLRSNIHVSQYLFFFKCQSISLLLILKKGSII